MKIKDFKFNWACCPNCGSENIQQKREGNERALFCKDCNYWLKEGFATFLLIKKDDKVDIEYDKYLPKA